MSSKGSIGSAEPLLTPLLRLPQELRDKIFHQLFNIASTIVVEGLQVDEDSNIRFKLLEPLPVNILRTSKKLRADATLELQKYIGTTKLVSNCYFSVFQEFIDSLPDYVKKTIFAYNEYTNFTWKKTSKEESKTAFYRQEAPMEICHLLETHEIHKVQFVYREIGEQYGEDCENLMHVQRVLRGAYEYPDGESKHEKPGQFAHELSEWQKLPKKFNVRREEKEDCRDELWWASAKVLVENYSADLLKGNGPRGVITLTRRKE